MRSVFYLLEAAPYGNEKAFGTLNAAMVSLSLGATLGLYGDGVYLALAGQDSRALEMPNLADLLYAYPELLVLAHEPSILARGLMSQQLIETIELVDDGDFLRAIEESNGMILL
jgi:tRNA 2-thiouridine synthesizing protein C